MNKPRSFEEVQTYLTQLENRLAKLESQDIDLHGRRIVNASDAKNNQDYATLNQLTNLASSLTNSTTPSSSESKIFSFATNSATQSIPIGAGGANLTFNVNISDSGTIHSTSVNPTRFTVSKAGLYLIFVQCVYPLSASGTYRQVSIYINGGVVTYPPVDYRIASTAAYPTLKLFSFYKFASTDYIEFVTQHDAAGAQTLLADYTFGGILKIN